MSTRTGRTIHILRWGALALGLSLALGPASQAQAQVSFAPQATFATGLTPIAVALGDLDGDGNLDLVVANNASAGPPTVSVRLGNGLGGFGAETTFAVGNSPNDVALGNLNAGAVLDLVVANGADDTVSVLLGNGLGGFGVQTTFAVGNTPNAVALGDLDGDGDLDIVVTNGTDSTVSVLLGNGLGGFGAQTTFATGFTPVAVALGDLDGDGDLDIAVANNASAPPTISVLRNTGTGSFLAQVTFPVGFSPNAVALGDLDGDGDLDVVVANGADNTVSVLLNTTAPPAPPVPPAGGGGGGCFIATAAFGSPLASQVHLLREFRDRFLLPHAAGQMFVDVYYALSPPLAEVIAESQTLRAIVRTGLIPFIGWAALLLWSPLLGLGTLLLLSLGIGNWLVLWVVAQRSQWAGARRTGPRAGKVTQSCRSGRWRRVALWGCVFLVWVAATIVEATAGKEMSGPVKVVADVRLPKLSRFALIQDLDTGHLNLYTRGESIHAGENPLPLGKIVAMDDEVLVLAFPGGKTIEIPRGERLPGPRGLIFVRSALLDSLRYQVRFAAAAPSSQFSVVDIIGRRAIFQRTAIPDGGEHPAVLGQARSLMRAPLSSGPSPSLEGAALAELVDQIPFDEVARDTWEIPRKDAEQIGSHLGPLLTDTFHSAEFIVDTGWGAGLRVNTALGTGTLDRRGFLIEYAKLARRTGLEVGDRILSVNEQPVNTVGGLVRIYRQIKSDSSVSEVKVLIERNSKPRTLTYHIR